MSGIEIGAVIGLVELCLNLGKAVLTQYEVYKNAEASFVESIIRLESTWSKTTLQLNFLRSIWQTMNPGHQRLQEQVVEVLVGKLRGASTAVERVSKKTNRVLALRLNKWKYMWLKDCLDGTLQDLDSWQKLFDPSWFLIMRISSPQIDQQLSQVNATSAGSKRIAFQPAMQLRSALRQETSDNKANIFLPSHGLSLAKHVEIPFSTMKRVQRTGSTRWLLFETFHQLDHSDPTAFLRDVRDIARKLSYSDALEFRLFNCYGVLRNFDGVKQHPTSCTFVYRMPEGLYHPHSLRESLCNGNTSHSLSERFQVAKDLMRAVSSVHSFGFVHKNIRPEVFLLLTDDSIALGTPFLAGFEAFRNAEGRTMRLGDTLWYRNIYRHPNRQGLRPSEDFVMQHDIYSLGVCLLELGLFRSFVEYDAHSRPGAPSVALGLSFSHLQSMQPFQIKDHLVSIAKTELPKHMGNRYSSVVISCLTCLDEDNADFGDETEFQDSEGVLINVRYIEKILVRLNELEV